MCEKTHFHVFSALLAGFLLVQLCACFKYNGTYKSLIEIPSDVPAECAVIDLSHNSIFGLRSDDFTHVTQCTSLDLSNKISTVEDFTFRGLINLLRLYLCNNFISVIKEEAFNGLDNLLQLYIHTNPIVHVPLGILTTSTNAVFFI